MSEAIWTLFPYPTLAGGELTAGALLDVHPDCATCPTQECASDHSAPAGDASQCRYGISYARLDPNRVVVGVLAIDLPNPTKRSRKRLKEERERHVRSAQLKSAIGRAVALGPGIVEDHDRARTAMMKQLKTDPEMLDSIARELRKDFESNLSQSHDFLQLVNLVRGHAEALLHAKYPSLPSLDAAEKLPTEGAIFFLTELMLAKMDSLVFLNEINRAFGSESRFQVHPLVLKYVRIYNSQSVQKELSIRLEGECYAWSRCNNKAIGAVIQGLLDNLVKYAPAGSKAAVVFDEEPTAVYLTFTSLGPRIDPDEKSQIFLPRYRARAAAKVEGGGMGIGLAIAKQVSDALDLELSVDQDPDPDPSYSDRYRTSFRLKLERVE